MRVASESRVRRGKERILSRREEDVVSLGVELEREV